jgi:predicted nucleic acid-binding protein
MRFAGSLAQAKASSLLLQVNAALGLLAIARIKVTVPASGKVACKLNCQDFMFGSNVIELLKSLAK